MVTELGKALSFRGDDTRLEVLWLLIKNRFGQLTRADEEEEADTPDLCDGESSE